MAQQYKHCAFLPCIHIRKKKAFLLPTQFREKRKGRTSQKSLIIQYKNQLFSMNCCRELLRKAALFKIGAEIIQYRNYLIKRVFCKKKEMSSSRIMKQSSRNYSRLKDEITAGFQKGKKELNIYLYKRIWLGKGRHSKVTDQEKKRPQRQDLKHTSRIPDVSIV